MKGEPAILESDRVQTYCREARKLRHRLRHAPVRLHRSLRSLRPAAALPVELTTHDRFAQSVVTAIQGRTLRYSRRLRLLAEADKLGIERFEANLIIAMVQHRLNALPSQVDQPPRRLITLLTVLAVQACIAAGGLCIWMSLR